MILLNERPRIKDALVDESAAFRPPSVFPQDGSDGGTRRAHPLFCGLPITVGFTQTDVIHHTFESPLGDYPILTTFINPLAFQMARDNKAFAATLSNFDLILPDGIGLIIGLRLIGDSRTQRLSFDSTSLALPILRRAGVEGRSVMLIGGIPGVCLRAKEQLAEAIPSLHISKIMDGFQSFRDYEAVVRQARPDIIVCGMGAPRQEELLLMLKAAQAWRGLGFTCGGYLDQLQQRLHYYPVAINTLELRWLYRLLMEPRRLFRRYAFDYQAYSYALIRELLRSDRTSL